MVADSDKVCPECGMKGEFELEQDFGDDDELIAEDLVCGNCGYVERVY